MRTYLSAALDFHVVPTAQAPVGAELRLPYEAPLNMPFDLAKRIPSQLHSQTQRHALDIHVAGLGFVTLSRSERFNLKLLLVAGTGYSIRKPLYARHVWRSFSPHLSLTEAKERCAATLKRAPTSNGSTKYAAHQPWI